MCDNLSRKDVSVLRPCGVCDQFITYLCASSASDEKLYGSQIACGWDVIEQIMNPYPGQDTSCHMKSMISCLSSAKVKLYEVRISLANNFVATYVRQFD